MNSSYVLLIKNVAPKVCILKGKLSNNNYKVMQIFSMHTTRLLEYKYSLSWKRVHGETMSCLRLLVHLHQI